MGKPLPCVLGMAVRQARSVPPLTTAATGVDALTHAIEGFTATCAEPIGDAFALYSIELICRSLPAAAEFSSMASSASVTALNKSRYICL